MDDRTTFATPNAGARRSPGAAGPVLLDGRRLARERTPGLAARAAQTAQRRGRPPRLLLVAFAGPDGRAPSAELKLRACASVGVEATPILLAAGAGTDDVRRAIADGLAAHSPDAVFVEFPFPEGVDGDAVMAFVPEPLDVDVMTPGRIRRYLDEGAGVPPLTVAAALALLDRYDVSVAGLDGIVIAEPSPFAEMFRAALARRDARMRPLVPPTAPDLARQIGAAKLVVAAAARPGLIDSAMLAPGTVAIDGGYYNPGGRGDIDLAGGTSHLAALAPVPGGLGPMTVSMLLERTIEFAASPRIVS